MKKIKRLCYLVAVSVAALLTMTACGAISSMSEEEAYNFGYGVGRVAGYYLNN